MKVDQIVFVYDPLSQSVYECKIKKIISEKYFRKHFNEIDWHQLNQKQQLSYSFIREYKDQFNQSQWGWITWRNKMNKNFIRQFKDYIFVDCISSRDNFLSEDLIEQFTDQVDWNQISQHQKINKQFIIKHKDKINFYYLSLNKYVNKKLKKELGIYRGKNIFTDLVGKIKKLVFKLYSTKEHRQVIFNNIISYILKVDDYGIELDNRIQPIYVGNDEIYKIHFKF